MKSWEALRVAGIGFLVVASALAVVAAYVCKALDVGTALVELAGVARAPRRSSRGMGGLEAGGATGCRDSRKPPDSVRLPSIPGKEGPETGDCERKRCEQVEFVEVEREVGASSGLIMGDLERGR